MMLQLDRKGIVHILDRKPVHAGDALEVLFGDKWLRVRYEWPRKDDDPRGFMEGDEIVVRLKPDTVVRWPER